MTSHEPLELERIIHSATVSLNDYTYITDEQTRDILEKLDEFENELQKRNGTNGHVINNKRSYGMSVIMLYLFLFEKYDWISAPETISNRGFNRGLIEYEIYLCFDGYMMAKSMLTLYGTEINSNFCGYIVIGMWLWWILQITTSSCIVQCNLNKMCVGKYVGKCVGNYVGKYIEEYVGTHNEEILIINESNGQFVFEDQGIDNKATQTVLVDNDNNDITKIVVVTGEVLLFMDIVQIINKYYVMNSVRIIVECLDRMCNIHYMVRTVMDIFNVCKNGKFWIITTMFMATYVVKLW